MGNTKKVTMPRYQQVAIEISERIASGQYRVGEKIHARSTLANTFGVSPETARKAVNVLVDLGIMEAKHGSGTIVSSKIKAEELLSQHRDIQSIQEIKQDVFQSIETQKQEFDNMAQKIERLIQQTKKMNQVSPFIPAELVLTDEASHLEKSISELNLWHETAATVVAISHADELLLSPGPYAKLQAGDCLYFVGDEYAKQKMFNYFYPNGTA